MSEKTNRADWARQVIRSAGVISAFGYQEMPHFYGLSNICLETLPADQKEFPAAEIHAIAAYLFNEKLPLFGRQG